MSLRYLRLVKKGGETMKSIEDLIPAVLAAGRMAVQEQKKVTRSYKDDGSILTQVDKDVDQALSKEIASRFPMANIITEESLREFDINREFTFAVDPIDGTDSYSQGMPGWCISVGVLDSQLMPVAGIVYAPKWGAGTDQGSLIFADLGKTPLINEQPVEVVDYKAKISRTEQIMIGSKLHKHFDLGLFPGKCRNIGSTVLHILAQLMHTGIIGTLLDPPHIWDIAGAHAIAKAHGLSVEYLNNGSIDYRELLDGSTARDYILSGTEPVMAAIRRLVTTKPQPLI